MNTQNRLPGNQVGGLVRTLNKDEPLAPVLSLEQQAQQLQAQKEALQEQENELEVKLQVAAEQEQARKLEEYNHLREDAAGFRLTAAKEEDEANKRMYCRPERTGEYGLEPSWNGDKRQLYNEFTSREMAKKLAGMELSQKQLVLLYFAGNMQKVLARYELFDGEEGDPEEYPGQGWLKNQHILAEKGIFGTMQQAKEANLHDVLLFLEENKKDIKRSADAAANERNKREENQ
ncbi:hypothetical protein GO755_35060 [Spirosoma sp. HMF4905]|uniref:Uncharacterized protein n=1 Tax=Spirosoma arboris TaxID=2682092 RepID=A0A7K1SNC3_9BACT|nr:hypothetical protein [Spirosoma arboris]MVM35295.1 hypothetical protein [Spirosoma arboris]